MYILLITILLALIFDYINGFHDAANSIATIVSTKVLTPFQAVVWAAVFNFVAFWIFKDHAVANTISKTVIKDFITLQVIFSGVIAAILWNLLTWWYGIPTSSSHTLIGGFAGAALTHAVFVNGFNIPWNKVIDSDTIVKSILFIFFAPLMGMAISIFLSIVTMHRNIWIRILIIIISTAVTVVIFDRFEENKMDENLQKYIKLDKYKTDYVKAKESLKQNPNDTTLLLEFNKVEKKLNSTKEIYTALSPVVNNYDKLGADSIAKFAYQHGYLKEIEISKLKDEVRNANDFLILESDAANNKKFEKKYSLAKTETEKYKEPIKKFLHKEISLDSTIIALNTIYTIKESNIEKIKSKLSKFNIESNFKKDIEKSDNKYIVWGIALVSLLFILIYIYVEKIKSPTASSVSNMFKKLQLLSSALFSIGHGGNDAQKVMGIIGAALIAGGQIQEFSQLPSWVPIACYTSIALGTLSGGWRIVKTMGTKITKVTPLEGVSAETAGAFTLFFTGQMGIPVSTTHTITGSIIGVGATKRLSAVRWGVTTSLMVAWILTIPVSGLLAALVYWISTFFF